MYTDKMFYNLASLPHVSMRGVLNFLADRRLSNPILLTRNSDDYRDDVDLEDLLEVLKMNGGL